MRGFVIARGPSTAEPAIDYRQRDLDETRASPVWRLAPMAAWMDRGAARDLYDLWALDRVGAFNAESAAVGEDWV